MTGLANRNLFSERLAQWVAAATHEGRRIAVVVIDIDRFRLLNESLGRHVGDRLLRRVGERIVRCMDDSPVAHLGAGHFGVVLDDLRHVQDAARFIREGIDRCFSEPFSVDGGECRVSARAGIAFCPDDSADASLLLRDAESAAERAKARGEVLLAYTGEMTATVAARVALEARLRGALARGEFEVFYQPKVTVPDRSLVAVEALIRWRTPDAGLVLPGVFIPVLEETGLVCDVGDWVLARAARDRREWAARGCEAPRVAVNVSVAQLRRPDFVERLRGAIGPGDAGIDLEITESLLMHDIDDCVAKLTALRALGVSVAIDDFGTGYSSLGYLARLPVQALKIDREFVAALSADGHAMALAGAIVSMGRSLGLTVIAEGVETEEQASALRGLGCDQMQGFLCGRPVSAAELGSMLLPPATPRREDAHTGALEAPAPAFEAPPALADSPGTSSHAAPL